MRNHYINNNFKKEKHFVITAATKVLAIFKTYEEVENFFKKPTACINHPFDELIEDHSDCPNHIPIQEYRHVNMQSSQPKYFISAGQDSAIYQFNHIWTDYLYKLYEILLNLEKDNYKNSLIILLGNHMPRRFSPEVKFYQYAIDKMINDFPNQQNEILYSLDPVIYEIDNFYAFNYNWSCPITELNKLFVNQDIKPTKKVYASRMPQFILDFYKYKDMGHDSILTGFKQKSYRKACDGFCHEFGGDHEISLLDKKIYNETELEDFFRSNGFEIIDPGTDFHEDDCILKQKKRYDYSLCKNCSIEKAINYFNDVKLLISVSSSSLQNALFMKNSGTMVELSSKFYLPQEQVDLEEIYFADIETSIKENMMNEGIKNMKLNHIWHKDLAERLKINYISINNYDMNGRTIIDNIKNNSALMKLISE